MRAYTRAAALRRLILVDAENLMGPPPWTTASARLMAQTFLPAADYRAGDHVVVASSHHAAPSLFVWPTPAKYLWQSGSDGADLALLDYLARTDIVRAYAGGIVIGSGDHILAEQALALRKRGVPVTVIARRGSLSTRLATAATTTTLLPAYGLAA